MKLITYKTITEKEENRQNKTHRIKVINPDIIEQKNLTQQEVILLHLVNIGGVTNKICNEGYGYRHTPKIIENLKKNYGAQITTYRQKGLNILNRYKQKTEFVEYRLENAQFYKEVLNGY